MHFEPLASVLSEEIHTVVEDDLIVTEIIAWRPAHDPE